MKGCSFSVIIPTFRRPDKLKRAIRSVLNQTYKNYEVIVVDDDRENDLLESVIAECDDKRITLLKNSRTKGAHGARNTGILSAKNDFLTFLDDDDEWKSNHLAEINNYYSKNNSFSVTLSAHLIKEKSHTKKIVHRDKSITLKTFLQKGISVNAGTSFCCRRSLFKQVGLFDENMKREEDIDLLIRILKITPIALLSTPTAIIYGHNEPDIDVQIDTRNYLFKKLEKSEIDHCLIRPFKCRNFYELASFSFHNRQMTNGILYTYKAFLHGLINPLSYIKLSIVALDTYSGFNIEVSLKKVFFKPFSQQNG